MENLRSLIKPPRFQGAGPFARSRRTSPARALHFGILPGSLSLFSLTPSRLVALVPKRRKFTRDLGATQTRLARRIKKRNWTRTEAHLRGADRVKPGTGRASERRNKGRDRRENTFAVPTKFCENNHGNILARSGTPSRTTMCI